MKIPELHVINYAGFMDLKDEPYYEAKSVLNVEDYPEAELIAEEITRRSNCHNDLLEALEEAKLYISGVETILGEAAPHITKCINDAIKKARGL